MNKKDKLIESTIKALTGKLQESNIADISQDTISFNASKYRDNWNEIYGFLENAEEAYEALKEDYYDDRYPETRKVNDIYIRLWLDEGVSPGLARELYNYLKNKSDRDDVDNYVMKTCKSITDDYMTESNKNNKLKESIEWKKDIHDKNFDYKEDEKGIRRKINYDDEIYDFGTLRIKKPDSTRDHKFSIHHTINSHRTPKFNGSWNIQSVHPYDDASYHWARAYDGDNEYKIYRDSDFIESIKVSDISSDSEIERVAQRLLELDSPIESRMSYD